MRCFGELGPSDPAFVWRTWKKLLMIYKVPRQRRHCDNGKSSTPKLRKEQKIQPLPEDSSFPSFVQTLFVSRDPNSHNWSKTLRANQLIRYCYGKPMQEAGGKLSHPVRPDLICPKTDAIFFQLPHILCSQLRISIKATGGQKLSTAIAIDQSDKQKAGEEKNGEASKELRSGGTRLNWSEL